MMPWAALSESMRANEPAAKAPGQHGTVGSADEDEVA